MLGIFNGVRRAPLKSLYSWLCSLLSTAKTPLVNAWWVFSPFAFLTRRKSFCFSNKASYHYVSMLAEFFSLNYDISYGSKTPKLVLFKFQLKQPRCSFMSFSVFGTAFPWKPVMLDISFHLINQPILHIWLSFPLSFYRWA